MSILSRAKGIFIRTEKQQAEHEAKKQQAKNSEMEFEEKIETKKEELSKDAKKYKRWSKYKTKDLSNAELRELHRYQDKTKKTKTKPAPTKKKKKNRFQYERGILASAYKEAQFKKKKKKKSGKKKKTTKKSRGNLEINAYDFL